MKLGDVVEADFDIVANAIAAVARDARGQPVLKLKARKETLQVQPFAHRFRQM